MSIPGVTALSPQPDAMIERGRRRSGNGPEGQGQPLLDFRPA